MRASTIQYIKGFKRLPLSLQLSIAYLLLILFFTLFANLIANDVPIVEKQNGRIIWPVFDRTAYISKKYQHNASGEFAINTAVCFYYSSQDQKAGLVKPFTLSPDLNKTHWLGTDTYNRDVLSGLIHGSKIAIWVGLIASLFSALIGLLLGSLAGYYQNHTMRMNKYALLATLLFNLLTIYVIIWNPYLFNGSKPVFRIICWLLVLQSIINGFRFSIRTAKAGKNEISFPIDSIIMKTMEIFQSIPGLFLLICLISIIGSTNIFQLSLLIALLRWTSFTRLVRGETIKIKNTEYIQTAKALGISESIIIVKHIWPNLMKQLLIAFSYGVGASVLMEASLSFLGLGLAPDVVSWGSMLSQSRLQVNAWWLAVFPGIMISLLIGSCYTIGSYVIDKESKGIKDAI